VPGVPPRMMDILRACLAADPSRRLPSAASLRDELAAVLGGGPVRAPSREWPLPATPSTALTMTPAPVTTAARLPAATTQAGRRRPPLVLAAAGGAVAVAVVAVLLVAPRLLSPGGGGSPGSGQASPGTAGAGTSSPGASLPGAVGVFGVATTTGHCPAAAVPGAGGACVTTPECWAGVVDYSGVITAAPLPCTQPHTWQTYAIAMMPSESSTFNSNIVQASPTVQALCSQKVLLASRAGAALKEPQSGWSIQVMPPDEAAYDTGVRTYRCLAGRSLDELTSSQFGPN
jgi:hypothetical protein